MQKHPYRFKQLTTIDSLTYRLIEFRKTNKNLLCGLRVPNGRDSNQNVPAAHVNMDTFQNGGGKCKLK